MCMYVNILIFNADAICNVVFGHVSLLDWLVDCQISEFRLDSGHYRFHQPTDTSFHR